MNKIINQVKQLANTTLVNYYRSQIKTYYQEIKIISDTITYGHCIGDHFTGLCNRKKYLHKKINNLRQSLLVQSLQIK